MVYVHFIVLFAFTVYVPHTYGYVYSPYKCLQVIITWQDDEKLTHKNVIQNNCSDIGLIYVKTRQFTVYRFLKVHFETFPFPLSHFIVIPHNKGYKVHSQKQQCYSIYNGNYKNGSICDIHDLVKILL